MLVMVLAFCLLMAGCLALTPEQGERLESMNQRMAAINDEMVKVQSQMERLKERKAELLERLKNGELSAEDAAELIATVSTEFEEAVAHYNRLVSEGKALAQDIKALSDSGLPWWSIAIKVALAAAGLYLGNKNKVLGAGIQLLTKAIETGSIRDKKEDELKDLSPGEIACLMKKDIKKRVKNGSNPEVEKVVLKM